MSKENEPVSATFLVNLCRDFLDSYVASEQDYDDLDSPSHMEYNHYESALYNTLRQVNKYGVDIDL